MGGLGSTISAIVSIKNNRALIKKRKFKQVKDLLLQISGKTELEFKKVSPEELAKIKTHIRLEARKRTKLDIVITLLILMILMLLVILLLA